MQCVDLEVNPTINIEITLGPVVDCHNRYGVDPRKEWTNEMMGPAGVLCINWLLALRII